MLSINCSVFSFLVVKMWLLFGFFRPWVQKVLFFPILIGEKNINSNEKNLSRYFQTKYSLLFREIITQRNSLSFQITQHYISNNNEFSTSWQTITQNMKGSCEHTDHLLTSCNHMFIRLILIGTFQDVNSVLRALSGSYWERRGDYCNQGSFHREEQKTRGGLDWWRNETASVHPATSNS